MEEKSKFRFNNESERYHVLNRLFVLATDALMVIFLIFLWLKFAMKSMSLSIAIENTVVILVATLINAIIFFGKKDHKQLKTIISVEIGLEVFLLGVQTDAAFLGLALVCALAVQIPYYDKKKYMITVFIYVGLYLIIEILQSVTGRVVQDVGAVCSVLMMLGAFYVLIREGTISKSFSAHALGAVHEQGKKQKEMLEDIVSISQTVKE